ATLRVDDQSGERADDQCLPRVALQSDVNDDDERKIDVSQRLPNRAQRKLQHDRDEQNCGDLKLRHVSLPISDCPTLTFPCSANSAGGLSVVGDGTKAPLLLLNGPTARRAESKSGAPASPFLSSRPLLYRCSNQAG